MADPATVDVIRVQYDKALSDMKVAHSADDDSGFMEAQARANAVKGKLFPIAQEVTGYHRSADHRVEARVVPLCLPWFAIGTLAVLAGWLAWLAWAGASVLGRLGG